jgi:hypothetical protein
MNEIASVLVLFTSEVLAIPTLTTKTDLIQKANQIIKLFNRYAILHNAESRYHKILPLDLIYDPDIQGVPRSDFFKPFDPVVDKTLIYCFNLVMNLKPTILTHNLHQHEMGKYVKETLVPKLKTLEDSNDMNPWNLDVHTMVNNLVQVTEICAATVRYYDGLVEMKLILHGDETIYKILLEFIQRVKEMLIRLQDLLKSQEIM